jgi:hypothetical protein
VKSCVERPVFWTDDNLAPRRRHMLDVELPVRFSVDDTSHRIVLCTGRESPPPGGEPGSTDLYAAGECGEQVKTVT